MVAGSVLSVILVIIKQLSGITWSQNIFLQNIFVIYVKQSVQLEKPFENMYLEGINNKWYLIVCVNRSI